MPVIGEQDEVDAAAGPQPLVDFRGLGLTAMAD